MSFAPALFSLRSVYALWPPSFRRSLPFFLSFFLSSPPFLSCMRSHALIPSLFHSFIFPVFSIVLINFLLYLYSYLVPFSTYPFFVFREMVMVIIVNVFRFVCVLCRIFFPSRCHSFVTLSVSFSLSFIPICFCSPLLHFLSFSFARTFLCC